MDERKNVKGTNAARDKPMSSDSSTQLEHAAWQNGDRTPSPGTACTRSLGAFSPRKVNGTRAKDPRCAPAGFSQGPAYKSRPGLLTRLGQIGVLGSAGGSMGLQDVSSRAVSRDSQRLRHWTPDEPVDDLLIKVDRRLPSCSSSCLPGARSSHESRSQTHQVASFFLQPIAKSH